MIAASPSDWAAALCAALSVCATAAIPFLLWVDADYLLVADWQPVRDRVLVVVANAKYDAREARRRTASPLSAPTSGVTR